MKDVSPISQIASTENEFMVSQQMMNDISADSSVTVQFRDMDPPKGSLKYQVVLLQTAHSCFVGCTHASGAG